MLNLRRMLIAVVGLTLMCVATNGGAAQDLPAIGGGDIGQMRDSHALTPGALGFDEVIFVKRKPYSSDHYYTDINNGTSADRFLPDNGIYIYNVKTRKERPVVTAKQMPGGKGFIGKHSLSFDATQVIFDFRQDPKSGFRIWQVNTDGTGLRQLSFPPADEAKKVARWRPSWHTDDIHPCYLPDGSVIFSSTRTERTVLCGGSAALVSPTLHRMDADGQNIKALSQSLVSEFCPVVLDDGRVMYHRWEYVDKGARVGKTIWSMNPDGTHPQELYGLADDTTTVYMYPQPIPGSDHEVVCVGTCHFPQGGCLGAIMLIDFQRGGRKRGPDPDEAEYVQWDDRYPVTNITPSVFIERRTEPGWHFRQASGAFVHDRVGQSGHLYTHPYPVNRTTFLVSYKMNPKDHYKNVADAYGLYLIDTDGNHQWVHSDETLSCWHAMPLKSRKTPPMISLPRNPVYAAKDEAVCIVTNVYEGLEGVTPGEVKWLRINEAIPRYWDTGRRWGSSTSSSSWKAALWPRVQWGVVPVEADGSAYFTVPAERNIFFQALDKDFRELQRERTYVNYQPGEVRSCVGCHAQGGGASHPRTPQTTLALSRDPSVLQPQPCDLVENGGDGLAQQVIHYPTDIQPIFDAKCVSCHGDTDPDGGLKLTGNISVYYNTSYEQLGSKELAGPLVSEFTSFKKGDQGNYNGAFLPPKSLGTYRSVLVEILTQPAHAKNAQDDHSTMLTPMEMMVLNRWIDSNYQFYGTYYGRHHAKWVDSDPQNAKYDPADFRRKPAFEEAISFFAPEWHR